MTPEQRAELASAETAAIYRRCLGSTTLVDWRREAAALSTSVDRKRRAIHAPDTRRLTVIDKRHTADSRPTPIHVPGLLRHAIETVIARTGSVAAAMTATGCSYRVARQVREGMAA